MKRIVHRLFATVLLAFAGFAAVQAQSQFILEAPSVVAADEIFRVVYTATSEEKISGFVPPESFEGFEVLAGPIQSTMSSTNITNGKYQHSTSLSYTYTLRPVSQGNFTLPSATIKIGKKEHSSEPKKIEVVKASEDGNAQTGGQGSSRNAGDDLKLVLTLDKTEVVTGEPVIATLKLYMKQSDIGGFENIRFPGFKGFWSQEIEAPQNISFQRENYKGEVYNAALLRKYMLIPQQTGSLEIDPAELVCLVRIRSNSPSTSIFDDFFDSYQTIRKRVSTPVMKVNVSPLPSGAPASFNGGVGRFTLDVDAGSGEINAHEASSVKVTVSGSGNLNLISAPKLAFPSDFEVYDTKKTDNVTSGSNGVSGSITYEFPFIPRAPGEFTLKPVEISYYDIAARKYRTLVSPPIKIKVNEGERRDAAVIQSGPAKQSVRSLGEDIRFIATSHAGLHRSGRFAVTSLWFYAAIVLVFILSAATWILLRRRIAMLGDKLGTKHRKAMKIARNRLKKAREFMLQGLYAPFYEELHKALEGYISDKLMLPVSELNRDRIAAELQSMNKGTEVTEGLFEVLDACEYARYAPSSAPDAMGKHYEDAVKVISEIEK